MKVFPPFLSRKVKEKVIICTYDKHMNSSKMINKRILWSLRLKFNADLIVRRILKNIYTDWELFVGDSREIYFWSSQDSRLGKFFDLKNFLYTKSLIKNDHDTKITKNMNEESSRKSETSLGPLATTDEWREKSFYTDNFRVNGCARKKILKWTSWKGKVSRRLEEHGEISQQRSNFISNTLTVSLNFLALRVFVAPLEAGSREARTSEFAHIQTFFFLSRRPPKKS